jgi:hypothetical protein
MQLYEISLIKHFHEANSSELHLGFIRMFVNFYNKIMSLFFLKLDEHNILDESP